MLTPFTEVGTSILESIAAVITRLSHSGGGKQTLQADVCHQELENLLGSR